MKSALASALPICLAAHASAAPPRNPPLPPPRPKFEQPAKPPQPAPQEAAQPQAKAEPAPAKACTLANGSAEALPDIPGANGCGISSPVRLRAVVLANGSKVKVSPEATLACDMAGAFVAWVRDDLAPKLDADGAKLSEVQIAGSYECRPRNRVPGATISEHASGNALDVQALKLSDGKAFVIGKDKPKLFETVKATACGRFETVLGPGSDAEHRNHLHLDMRKRKTPHLFCQWDLDLPATQ